MDWVKVANALSNEWYNRREVAQMHSKTKEEAMRQQHLADMAFMLRDCLVAGMSDEEKQRLKP